MSDFFKGTKLYGDDFTLSEIERWYDEEKEAYAELIKTYPQEYSYLYHPLNIKYGFSKIPKVHYSNVLGIGSAYATEFEPIKDDLGDIYVLEPSDDLSNAHLGDKKINYLKPTVKGDIPFESNFFDLITCFGTLHHIPNVSFVFSEMVRVLKPGGKLLVREPIVSMGDWREKRAGLTKHERGIPIGVFEEMINQNDLKVISKSYCFCMTSFFGRLFGKYLNSPLISSPFYIEVDKWLSKLFASNIHYHAENKYQRICPQNVFFVLEK